MRQTFIAKPGLYTQDWYIVDATDKVLGRLAVQLATILMGKNKPTYTPHVDTGDYVVVVNARNIALTGNKAEQKFKISYSGYPSGQKAKSYGSILRSHPDRVLRDAVRRMLPKNGLAEKMLAKLKIYNDAEHPHTAQQPKPLSA